MGISVSRVGGNAQVKAMKKVAGTLKIDQAQYRELEAFTKFSGDMDPVTALTIDKGTEEYTPAGTAPIQPDAGRKADCHSLLRHARLVEECSFGQGQRV